MNRLLIAIFGLLVASVSAQVIPVTGTQAAAPTSSIIGQLQTTTGGTINSGTLTFVLSQPAVVSGSSSVVGAATSCYTSSIGNVVGIPDPILAPTLTPELGGSGLLPAATYYVKITYYSVGAESLPSPEAVATLNGLGSLLISMPAFQPGFPAIGIRVYVSTTSGAETLQLSSGSFGGGGALISTPLIAGTAPPVANTSVCNIYFSDQLVPTGTYYTVNLTNRNGSTVSGYPQTWCTYGGPGGTINVSNGAPTGNCNVNGVFYPTPIMASPQNGASQSISGPVSFTTATACLMNGVYMLNPGCYGPGLDIGGQVNAAYAACPLSGCVIQIPAGTYAFSTPIVFGTSNSQKAVILRCGGGTNGIPPNNGVVQLVYTGSGAAVSFNDGGVGAAGMQGCTLIGPSKAGTSVGLTCGSNPSGVCIGHVFDNNAITGFGVGIQLGGQYSFLNTFLNDDVADNGINLNLTSTGGNVPGNEENKFIGGILSNQSTPVLTSNTNCIETANSSAPYDVAFIGISLDQCVLNMAGSGQRFRFDNAHLELNPPFATGTPFINIAASCSTCNLQLVATDIIEDATGSGRTAMITNNNTLTPAAVTIVGGRFLGGGESSVPIVKDVPGTNLAAVQNTYKSGAIATDVGGPSGTPSGVMEWSQFTLAGTTPSLTINGTFSSMLNIVPATIGTIPLCGPTFKGSITAITNSNTQTWGATIGVGGLFAVIVCDGTNWTVMGI